MSKIIMICLGLLLAVPAQAQFIDCGAGGADCTDSIYGLGNDPVEGPNLRTYGVVRTGPGDGTCVAEEFLRHNGRIRIREQNNCDVSATTRCQIEIPQGEFDSGFVRANGGIFDLGAAGLLGANGGLYIGLEGNIGHRELSGTCTQDADEACALDSDCPSAAGCLSTCFSDPGTTCSSQADCAAADCRTQIDWNGIGTCTDDTTFCTSDSECTAVEGDFCEAGIELFPNEASCTCCQSSIGVICPVLGFTEYPSLDCPDTAFETNRVQTASPDWLFNGGAGTHFEMATIQAAGQAEGLCDQNRSRSCGPRGDFRAGAANGKCANTAPNAGVCPDPFDPANEALASACDDVDFGGIAGDSCDTLENGTRVGDDDILADGTQDPGECPSWTHIVGEPNELCAIAFDIPDGDPQPGCRLFNFGIVAQPDIDCNGIDDTVEGRCSPVGNVICSETELCPPCTTDADCPSGSCINTGDLCPHLGELNWFEDSNDEGIGDECQCGDGNGDGAITGLDIAATALCANGVNFCDPTIVDATGDNATTAEDIGGIVAAVNGTITTSDLLCVRNLPPAP